MVSYKLRCYIYQCKDLPAADSDGSSDPQIEVWSYEKERQKTPVVEDNLNPIFYSTIEAFFDCVREDEAPPIILNIYDFDDGLISDSLDFLGRAIINLEDSDFSEDDTIRPPKWHKVIDGFNVNSPSCGEILCSFALVLDDFRFKYPVQYFKLESTIPMKEQNVDINILGLRYLESLGILPVKKAFIRFLMKSLLPPEKSKAV